MFLDCWLSIIWKIFLSFHLCSDFAPMRNQQNIKMNCLLVVEVLSSIEIFGNSSDHRFLPDSAWFWQVLPKSLRFCLILLDLPESGGIRKTLAVLMGRFNFQKTSMIEDVASVPWSTGIKRTLKNRCLPIKIRTVVPCNLELLLFCNKPLRKDYFHVNLRTQLRWISTSLYPEPAIQLGYDVVSCFSQISCLWR